MAGRDGSKDWFSLNEVRVSKSEFSSIRIRKYRFKQTQKGKIGNPLREGGYIPVFTGDVFFVMTTKQQPEGKTFDDYFGTEVELQLQEEIGFLELDEPIQRRFIATLIEEGAESGIARSGSVQFFDTNKVLFKGAFDACNVDIRICGNHFSIFLDPSVLILLPLTDVSLAGLEEGRPIIRLVNEDGVERIRGWGHSPYPGKIGYFSRLETEIATIDDDTPVLVKRYPKAEKEIRYPAFALYVPARREEVKPTRHQLQYHIRPLPFYRLKRTKEWVARLFPDSKMTIRDRTIAVEDRVVTYYEPASYRGKITSDQALIYQETDLLFDRRAVKTYPAQLWGIVYHKPFDYNDGSREFSAIRPWVVVPEEEHLTRLAKGLCGFLASGYQKREGTSFGDIQFNGMENQFKVPFNFSPDEDIIQVDGSVESYLTEAENLLMRWKQTGSDPSRIVFVAVPDLYGGTDDSEDEEQETDDPYLEVKKLLVEGGLPSQMIEYNTLYDIEDPSVGYGYTVWTLALNLYVKLGGKPWTLNRPLDNVNCLIGIGFGRDSDAIQNQLYVGVANVFDEAGQWLSVSSEDKRLDEEDIDSIKEREYFLPETSSFKIKEDVTQRIVGKSLRLYKERHSTQSPQKVVVHKNGRIYDSEAAGFLAAVGEHIGNIQKARLGLVSIYKSNDLRMFGPPYGAGKRIVRLEHTVTRGCAFIFDGSSAVVATTGKLFEVRRGKPMGEYSYKGIGTPDPLIVERYMPPQELLDKYGLDESHFYTIQEICEHILALTKLHWGTMRQDIRLPVTSMFSQRIARFMARARIRAEESLKWTKPWWI
jgi:hypothetical protein